MTVLTSEDKTSTEIQRWVSRLVPRSSSPGTELRCCAPKSQDVSHSQPLPSTLPLPLLPLSPRSPWAAAPSHRCVGAETHNTYCLWSQVQPGPKSLWFNALRIGTSETITSGQYRNPTLLSPCPWLLLGQAPQRFAPILPRPILTQVGHSSLGLSHLHPPKHTGKLKGSWTLDSTHFTRNG